MEQFDVHYSAAERGGASGERQAFIREFGTESDPPRQRCLTESESRDRLSLLEFQERTFFEGSGSLSGFDLGQNNARPVAGHSLLLRG